MEKDEPEVVHLEWERVEDPTRDPPPEIVVAQPKPKPKPHIIPRWNDPNPFRSDAPPQGCVVEFLTLLVFLFLVSAATLILGALRGH